LILGVHNETILVVINGGCVINILNILEATSTTNVSTAIDPRSVFDERVVVLWAYATEHLLVLLRLHIGSEVVAENESVRVSTMCMLAIPVGDHRVVSMVTGLLPLESARVRHVLVVLGAVCQEFGIVGELTAMSRVSDCAEGSSGHCTNQSDESEC
jgi:hypothetical protein